MEEVERELSEMLLTANAEAMHKPLYSQSEDPA
jgi:hypothetical protein